MLFVGLFAHAMYGMAQYMHLCLNVIDNCFSITSMTMKNMTKTTEGSPTETKDVI